MWFSLTYFWESFFLSLLAYVHKYFPLIFYIFFSLLVKYSPFFFSSPFSSRFQSSLFFKFKTSCSFFFVCLSFYYSVPLNFLIYILYFFLLSYYSPFTGFLSEFFLLIFTVVSFQCFINFSHSTTFCSFFLQSSFILFFLSSFRKQHLTFYKVVDSFFNILM